MSGTCILLLSGPLAVGKTALREELVTRHGFAFLRSSQYLRSRAVSDGGTLDRSSLQNLGDRLDAETDYRWLIDDVALPLMASDPSQERWLVDAVRKSRQVEHFRAAFGSAVLHVHLTAPESSLRSRYVGRQEEQGSTADPTPYEKAIDHDNERAARSLIAVADLVVDVSEMSASDGAQIVVARLRG